MIASRRVDCRIGLGQVGGHAQLVGSGRRPRGRSADESIIKRRPGQLRVLPDPLGEGEAVHLRHHAIEQHQRERRAGRRAPARSAASASRPPSTTVGFMPQLVEHLLEDAPVGGVVVHDQDGQAVDLGRLRRRRPRRRPARPAEAER